MNTNKYTVELPGPVTGALLIPNCAVRTNVADQLVERLCKIALGANDLPPEVREQIEAELLLRAWTTQLHAGVSIGRHSAYTCRSHEARVRLLNPF